MSEFEAVLRNQIAQAQRGLEQAQQAGLDYEADRHGARLLDLLDRADAHGLDTSGWVPPEILVAASKDRT